jgi:hypothetical protein
MNPLANQRWYHALVPCFGTKFKPLQTAMALPATPSRDLNALSPSRCLRQAADHREASQLANVCQLPPRVRQAMRSTW